MKYFLLFVTVALFIISCEKREWNNPFDPDCPKEIFTPSGFQAVQQGSIVKLTWNQTNTYISGFVIERSVEGGTWSSMATPAKTETFWNDSQITGGKLHEYRLYSYAGKNKSNLVSTQIIPVISPTAVTMAATNITVSTATLNGTVNANGASTTVTFEYGQTTSYGQTVTASQSPVTGTSTTNVSAAISGLTSGTTYHFRVKAVSAGGTTYGSDLTFTTLGGSAGTVTDIEGNVYKTVIIGTQTWMAENLKTTKYNDGAAIPNVTDNTAWVNLITGAYCWYNNDAGNKNTYGALYNWYAVNTGKLCPSGWHVPSDAEWTTLSDYLGGEGVAGGKMKETGTAHWISPNTGATNESDFSGLPGGARATNGNFFGIGDIGYWWSSTESTIDAWSRYLYSNNSSVSRYFDGKDCGFSVRCVRDF